MTHHLDQTNIESGPRPGRKLLLLTLGVVLAVSCITTTQRLAGLERQRLGLSDAQLSVPLQRPADCRALVSWLGKFNPQAHPAGGWLRGLAVAARYCGAKALVLANGLLRDKARSTTQRNLVATTFGPAFKKGVKTQRRLVSRAICSGLRASLTPPTAVGVPLGSPRDEALAQSLRGRLLAVATATGIPRLPCSVTVRHTVAQGFKVPGGAKARLRFSGLFPLALARWGVAQPSELVILGLAPARWGVDRVTDHSAGMSLAALRLMCRGELKALKPLYPTWHAIATGMGVKARAVALRQVWLARILGRLERLAPAPGPAGNKLTASTMRALGHQVPLQCVFPILDHVQRRPASRAAKLAQPLFSRAWLQASHSVWQAVTRGAVRWGKVQYRFGLPPALKKLGRSLLTPFVEQGRSATVADARRLGSMLAYLHARRTEHQISWQLLQLTRVLRIAGGAKAPLAKKLHEYCTLSGSLPEGFPVTAPTAAGCQRMQRQKNRAKLLLAAVTDPQVRRLL